MNSTAEDLVIVYLGGEITHTALLQPGLAPATQKRAQSTDQQAGRGGGTFQRASGTARGSRATWVQKTKRSLPESSEPIRDLSSEDSEAPTVTGDEAACQHRGVLSFT